MLLSTTQPCIHHRLSAHRADNVPAHPYMLSQVHWHGCISVFCFFCVLLILVKICCGSIHQACMLIFAWPGVCSSVGPVLADQCRSGSVCDDQSVCAVGIPLGGACTATGEVNCCLFVAVASLQSCFRPPSFLFLLWRHFNDA